MAHSVLMLGAIEDVVIPLLAIALIFGTPVIAILTHHQRKMAELIHRKQENVSPMVMEEVSRLREEVSRLRTELHETTIALDDVRRGAPSVAVEQRVGGEN